jgi:putative phage-type endonuclease
MMPYRIIDLQQGSTEWLAWRRGKITASMAATILGVSPCETRLQLYNKILSGEETPDNEAMAHGRNTEPEARGWLIDRTGTPYSPVCIESTRYPWMAASLDGWNAYTDKPIVEIKCPMKRYAVIQDMCEVPAHYYPQLQHQLAVAGAEQMYFLTYSKSDQEGVIMTVKRDDLFIEKLIIAEESFYRRLVSFDPPDPIDGRDLVEINDPETKEWALYYADLCHDIEMLEKKKDECRKKLLERTDGRSIRIGDMKITKVIRKGNISYGDIPELQGVDLDAYRKPNITTWRFS